jgi:hypothetical protein
MRLQARWAGTNLSDSAEAGFLALLSGRLLRLDGDRWRHVLLSFLLRGNKPKKEVMAAH